ncbi:Peroxisomal membrane protein PEX14 [Halotydeus destructor]|nr:Peroxisomal membrane protein PEX14 [Halotydeus destructor]
MADESSVAALEDGQLSKQTEPKKIDHEIEPPLREDIINTAVHFLVNDRVKNSPLDQKRTFLLRKGLTSVEIDVAIDKAASGQLPTVQYGQVNQFIPSSQPFLTNHPYGHIQSPTSWAIIKSVTPPMAFVAGVAYGLYLLYKNYVEPWLFGKRKHPLIVIQTSIEKLTKSMDNLSYALNSVELNIKNHIDNELSQMKKNHHESASLNDIKSEVLSLKALLLNRKQFTAAPKIDATIPSWQLDDEKPKSPNLNGNSAGSSEENSD